MPGDARWCKIVLDGTRWCAARGEIFGRFGEVRGCAGLRVVACGGLRNLESGAGLCELVLGVVRWCDITRDDVE